MIKLNSPYDEFKFVGLTGQSRCGKDTLGSALFMNDGYTMFSFAYAMKMAAVQIFDLDEEQVNGDKKEVFDEFWQMTPRTILQKFGTEAMRGVFGENIWVKILAKQIEMFWEDFDEESDIVITDVRFDNEAEFIRDNGGVVIRIIRDEGNKLSQDEKAHASEAGVKDELVDFIIHNNDTKLAMYQQAEHFLQVVHSRKFNHANTSI
ncbi:MAG: hypothetical protein GTN99_02900 [Candidatus Dadabacteria bacterium]|nr:hypothetical protein [Candidatus Dadabacteria bacterium]